MRTHGIICVFLLVASVHAQAPVESVEYWFDQSQTMYSITNPVNSAVLDLSDAVLNSDGLPVGPHSVHLRLKENLPGANGVRYGSVVSRPFQKYQDAPWQITAVRYWMSETEVPADMHYRYFATPQTNIDYNGVLEMCFFPEGTGSLKLQLMDNHGQWSSVVSRTVTINPPGALVVDAITASALYCPGQTVTFTAVPATGNGFAIPTSYTWTTPTGNGWSATPTTGNTIEVMIGNTPGLVKVYGNNACNGGAEFTMLVTPVTPPVLALLNWFGDTVCPSTSDLHMEVTANPDWTYNWTIPNGWSFQSNTGASVTLNAGPNAQSGNITTQATNSCGQVSNMLTVAVSVAPLPGPTGAITGDAELCAGSTGNYQVPGSANASGYDWSSTLGFAPDGQTPSTAVTVGSTSGMITVHGVNQCGSGPESGAFAVTVNTPPTAPDFVSGPGTLCGGLDTTWAVQANTNSDTTIWSLPAGWTLVSSTSTSLTTMVGVGAPDGELIVQFQNNCGTNTTALPFTVLDVPGTPGPITGADTACVGDFQTYTLEPVSDAFQYTWIGPWSGATSTEPSHTFQVIEQTGQLSVWATNECFQSGPSTLNVVAQVPPQPPVISGDTVICPGGSVTLEVADHPGESYLWSGVAQGTGTSILAGASGNLTVTATTGPACAAEATMITIEESTLDSIAGPLDIMDSGTLTYTALGTFPEGTTFTWDLPFFAEPADSDTNSTIINIAFVGTGVDSLCVSANAPDCTSEFCMQVSSSVGLDSPEETARLSPLPNPSSGFFYLNGSDRIAGLISCKILDATGKTVATANPQQSPAHLDLPYLASGTYVLHWTTDVQHGHEKLVIQH